eukprot:CAMPEP_0206493396 /NCGR_PEP_ID=MMETSP0324_2-20121206/46930_1 /ASSEMBLY_ACC=CAM_ASM_000836 /TAXON_ID=2866 /ORGANISM="Crypthecodinium cohnii, Strain Seligo" /LENGTH=43 /DNA_ID= /DNA_START= /DNA_END= /DNA_ORIENTATION=
MMTAKAAGEMQGVVFLAVLAIWAIESAGILRHQVCGWIREVAA